MREMAVPIEIEVCDQYLEMFLEKARKVMTEASEEGTKEVLVVPEDLVLSVVSPGFVCLNQRVN